MKNTGSTSSEPGGTRQGPKLERLLSVAAGLMADRGFAQTTMRDVARETGYSLAGMYYYFENKDDLLFQIQQRSFSSLLAEQEAAVAGNDDAADKLRRLVDNHLAHFTRNASELKVCTFELQTLERDRYELIADLRRRYFSCMASVLGELMDESDEGVVRRHTLLVFGMLNWIFMWYDPERDGEVSTLGDEMIELIRGGLPGASRKDPA
jgi:TetR/AcrR family transcriptional regulator, cholesterol catabolism regulator